GAIESARFMQSIFEGEVRLIPVFGLVGTETAIAPGDIPEDVVLPVATFENLLLDTGPMWDLMAPFQAVTGLGGESEVSASLRNLSEERRAEEIDLRVRAWL